MLLAGKFKEGDTVLVEAGGGVLTFKAKGGEVE